ncbi:MAG TPA: phosphohistidine phosphatase SixA [Vicinamibacterales bacterium]
MKCYLVRHGQAVDADAWPGADAERPLTEKGRARMERAAAALAALDLDLDAILTSPLLRAKQTATIIARALHAESSLREDARLGGGFGPEALAAILSDHADADAVMVVGHEPGMSTTVETLCGAATVFKPGSIACVELARATSKRGMLLWLAPAKLLAVPRRARDDKGGG